MARPIHVRSRFWLGAGIALVIALGLASRKFPGLFPAVLGKYPGDALWALAVLLICAFVKPGASATRLAISALAISYLDELSQLYAAPWLNAVRRTTVGHLVLGSVFSWLDICAYTVGVAVGFCVDGVILRLVARDYPKTETTTTQ